MPLKRHVNGLQKHFNELLHMVAEIFSVGNPAPSHLRREITSENILRTNVMFYDKHFNEFDGSLPFKTLLPRLILKYSLQELKQKILDIGAGPGILAKWVHENIKGSEVVCLDPSEEMIRSCHDKGLKTEQTTFQEFEGKESFDQIFAISSLIHIPGHELKNMVAKIAQLLTNEGTVYVSLLLGESGWSDPTNSGDWRFFTRMSREAVFDLFSSHFKIMEETDYHSKSMGEEFIILVLKKKV